MLTVPILVLALTVLGHAEDPSQSSQTGHTGTIVQPSTTRDSVSSTALSSTIAGDTGPVKSDKPLDRSLETSLLDVETSASRIDNAKSIEVATPKNLRAIEQDLTGSSAMTLPSTPRSSPNTQSPALEMSKSADDSGSPTAVRPTVVAETTSTLNSEASTNAVEPQRVAPPEGSIVSAPKDIAVPSLSGTSAPTTTLPSKVEVATGQGLSRPEETASIPVAVAIPDSFSTFARPTTSPTTQEAPQETAPSAVTAPATRAPPQETNPSAMSAPSTQEAPSQETNHFKLVEAPGGPLITAAPSSSGSEAVMSSTRENDISTKASDPVTPTQPANSSLPPSTNLLSLSQTASAIWNPASPDGEGIGSSITAFVSNPSSNTPFAELTSLSGNTVSSDDGDLALSRTSGSSLSSETGETGPTHSSANLSSKPTIGDGVILQSTRALLPTLSTPLVENSPVMSETFPPFSLSANVQSKTFSTVNSIGTFMSIASVSRTPSSLSSDIKLSSGTNIMNGFQQSLPSGTSTLTEEILIGLSSGLGQPVSLHMESQASKPARASTREKVMGLDISGAKSPGTTSALLSHSTILVQDLINTSLTIDVATQASNLSSEQDLPSPAVSQAGRKLPSATKFVQNTSFSPSYMRQLPTATSLKPVTTPLPAVIRPSGREKKHPKGTLPVQIGFLSPLNYNFVSSDTNAASEIFQRLPQALADAGKISVSTISVYALVPYDTRNQWGYVTTVAKLYYPEALIDKLQMDIWSPNSGIYNNAEALVQSLTALINPKIDIRGNTEIGGLRSPSAAPIPTTSSENSASAADDGGSQSAKQRATTIGIAMGAVSASITCGAALFFWVSRYRRNAHTHRRLGSMNSHQSMYEVSLKRCREILRYPIGATRFHEAEPRLNSQYSRKGVATNKGAISAPIPQGSSLGWI